MWDVKTGERVTVLTGHTDQIFGLAYSPDGALIATASWDGTVRVWDAHSGEERLTLADHQDKVWSVAFSPDGRQIASGDSAGTVRLWNVKTGNLEAMLPEVVGQELVVNWEINQEEGTINKLNSVEELNIAFVYDLNYSPSGDRVIAAGTDGSVNIYVADPGALLEIAREQVARRPLIPLGSHTVILSALGFGENGVETLVGNTPKNRSQISTPISPF